MPLKKSIYLGFGIGSLGSGIFATVPGLLLLYYMTSLLGIPASLAGIAIFLPKLWDIFVDPIIGLLSDRSESRFGRRRPFLLAGAILMSLFFVALFHVPDYPSAEARFAYVLVMHTLLATSFSIFAVPYIAMPAEMAENPHERTIIMSYRMMFAMAGILLGGGLAPVLVDWGGGGRGGYALMSLVLGSFCLVSMLGSFFGTKAAPFRRRPLLSDHFSNQLKSMGRHRNFLLLLATYFIQVIAVGCYWAMLPYYVKYFIFGSGNMIALDFLVLNGVAILAMPLWVWLSHKLGKMQAYSLSSALMAGLFALLWLCSHPGQINLLLTITVGLGVAFAGQQVLAFSLLSDLAAETPGTAQAPLEGLITGIWTAGEKVALALGGFIAASGLSLARFIESQGQAIIQPETALTAIHLTFSVIPALLFLASIGLALNLMQHLPQAAPDK